MDIAWKDIKGYEDSYARISIKGIIKSKVQTKLS